MVACSDHVQAMPVPDRRHGLGLFHLITDHGRIMDNLQKYQLVFLSYRNLE